jgi:hypothetical protein
MREKFWSALAVIGTTLVVILSIVGLFLIGKDETPQVKRARAREKKAKLRDAALHYEIAKSEAAEAESDEDAKVHYERADTLQIRVADLQKAYDEMSGDLSDSAKSVSDDELADSDNLARANGRAGSIS